MSEDNAILRKAVAELAGRNAALEAGAHPDLLGPHVASRTQVDVVEGKVRIRVTDENGNPIIANSRGELATPASFAAALKQESRFAAAFGVAEDKAHPAPPGTGGVITRAAFDAMSPADRQRAMARGSRLTG